MSGNTPFCQAAFKRIILIGLLAVYFATNSANDLHAQSGVSSTRDVSLLLRLSNHRPSFFMGAALSTKRAQDNDTWDGSANFGLSFGDLDRNVNIRIASVVTSLTDDFGDSGYLSASIARRQEIAGVPIVGVLSFENLAGWGDAKDNVETFQLTVSVAPIVTWSSGKKTQFNLALAVKAAVEDPSEDPEYIIAAGAFFPQGLTANVAVVDGVLNIGSSYTVPNAIGAGSELYFGVTLADALNSDDFRRFVFRSGLSIPF